MSFNLITIQGNAGKDIETRKLESGQTVGKFSIATDDGYFHKENKEWVPSVNWHLVIVWGHLAERLSSRIKKGTNVLCCGKMTYREYEDKDGVKRRISEVVANNVKVLEKREARPDSGFPEAQKSEGQTQKPTIPEPDDQFPF